ncbi:MAG: acyl-CoA dehydrogenase, partial [Rhodospirillaceae bacterium]|nr:acyl-CoA dehydrogenase [Rhodospirillaceae bacterium]
TDAGWHGISLPQEYGGQGLPFALSIAASEMWSSANMAIMLTPQLIQSSTELLYKHASDSQKDTYLPNIVSGKWATTMNLTEPQAGTDLNLLRTKAVPEDDHYRISGQKIFITGGDHDLTENIIHLVLARLPDAPEGLKGISLFLVPKFLVNDDGSLGPRNDVKVVSIEHKLGIHGSPTCVMSYGDDEGAIGYLIGEENQGLLGMFTMMNLTRLLVSTQGSAIGERAFQRAATYAKERLQGSDKSGNTVAIINHPDVKRMLLDMKSKTEASRNIGIYTAACIDRSKRAPDEAQQALYRSRTELLTPVAKAWSTNIGIDIASTGIQIHGGNGYVEETGAAQYLRDIRIAAIYEGTNGVQAKDLVGRKIIRDEGQTLTTLAKEIDEFADGLSQSDDAALNKIGSQLGEAVTHLTEATSWIMKTGDDNLEAVLSSAAKYLELLGNVIAGWLLAKSAACAAELIGEGGLDDGFLSGKIATCRYFSDHQLALCASLKAVIVDGANSIVDFDKEWL